MKLETELHLLHAVTLLMDRVAKLEREMKDLKETSEGRDAEVKHG